MIKIAFVGYRGMVGSVLYNRFKNEGDFYVENINFKKQWTLFSTTNYGQKSKFGVIGNANDIEALRTNDIVITCQGGDWTNEIYPKLRESGWNGYWIDASSALRMDADSIIALDPVNQDGIVKGIKSGIKNYIGGNCTVSLMLMAINGLFKKNLVEWVIANTYQAASGAGSKSMQELIKQTKFLTEECRISDYALDLDLKISENIFHHYFPKDNFKAPLAFGWIPWIDSDLGNGQSREEWKGWAETNKILQSDQAIPVEGTCIRVPAMRCHGQALALKLKEDLPESEIVDIISSSNQWVKVIPNNKEDTISNFHPANISGTLAIHVGRIRTMKMGNDNILNLFTVGDQLLWGAAEPLRRVLKIIIEEKFL